MTVPAQATLFNESVANGVTTSFPYQFMIASADDLAVELDGVATTTGFTVTGVGDANGGDIVFSVPPANGVKVLRYLDSELNRTEDYQQFGDFNADTVDLEFDRLWLAMQAHALKLGLCVRAPISSASGVLPAPAANNVIGWNEDGTGFKNFAPTDNTLLAASLASAGGSSFIGWINSIAGSVLRSIQDKSRDTTSIKDIGAVCNGIADDTLAIQQCCTNGGAYYIPFGSVIRLTAPILVSAPVIFFGHGCIAFKDLNESAANVRGDGSWFYFDHTGNGFVADGTSGAFDGVAPIRFIRCGSFRNQPTPGAGAFTPTANDWDFYITDCEIELDDFVALNPTKFFTASLARGGRVRLNNVRGQPLSRGISIDNCYDVCHIDAHFWPYWSLNTNVAAYTKANLQSLITGRVDGLLLQRFFTIYHYIGWNVLNNGAGVVNRARGAWVYLDNGARGIVVNSGADGATIHMDEYTAYGLSGSASYGLEVSANNCHITAGFADFDTFYNQAIYLSGTGNRVQIDCPKFANYSYQGAGPGIVNGAGNEIIFNGKVDDSPLASRFLMSGSGLINAVDQWTSYTPAVTPSTGSITTLGTVSAKYRTVGDWVDVVFSIQITTNGTGAGSIRMPLPFTPSEYAAGAGRETVATGNGLVSMTVPGNSLLQIFTYNNGYPGGDGRTLIGSISYRK